MNEIQRGYIINNNKYTLTLNHILNQSALPFLFAVYQTLSLAAKFTAHESDWILCRGKVLFQLWKL